MLLCQSKLNSGCLVSSVSPIIPILQSRLQLLEFFPILPIEAKRGDAVCSGWYHQLRAVRTYLLVVCISLPLLPTPSISEGKQEEMSVTFI